MRITVNGVPRDVTSDWRDETLLSVLRDHLALPGTRFSCGIGACGACVVHLNGKPVNSCRLIASDVADQSVLTIEGLAAPDGTLHALQQAWLDERVPQCGFCQSGQIMRALALLQSNPDPTDADIDQSMSGNLCRCGTYDRIRRAIHKAANTLGPQGE